jgi:hypothetical protein
MLGSGAPASYKVDYTAVGGVKTRGNNEVIFHHAVHDLMPLESEHLTSVRSKFDPHLKRDHAW